MPRLLASLAAAAAVLADQAATRLDTWVENTTDTNTPRETPIGFTIPTIEHGKGLNAMALTGEQRAQWLDEVQARLNASTGGPWCTEERDNPTGRIISPYGVIATGVTREADRDLIEDARADLFGLLALAKYDDQVIAEWSKSTADYAARAGEAERELEGMQYRERQVDKVVAAWDTKRAGLNGYDGTIDPETPAGRVVELLHELCKARPVPNRSIEARTAALTAIENNLTEHNIDISEGDYPDVIVDAVRLALADRAEAFETADTLRRQLDAAAETDSPFMPEASASQLVHTIGVALNMYGKGHDPLASLCLRHPLDLSGRVAELASHALRLRNAATDIDKGGAMYYAGMRDAAALAPEETIEAVRAAASARIRDAADTAAQAIALTPDDGDEVDAAAADAFVAGLRAAADLAEDKTPEADPNVAHIDTVNGRAAAADEAPDDMPVVTPGSFMEAVLDTGGTVVIDDNGDPHVTDMTIGADPAAVGTLITADGKRHPFIGGTLITAGGGGYGSAGAPDDDNPPPRVVLSENGYVLDVIEADDEDAPDER